MTMKAPFRSALLAVVVSALALTGCGSDGDTDANTTPDSNAVADDSQGAADDIQQNLEDAQQQQGGGSATLVVGGTTYEFDSVLCAFGTEETRSDEYDFSLSSIQDGTQLSVSRAAEGGQFGDSVSLDDIEDFENPSVSWSAPAPALPTAENPTAEQNDSFVEIDGKNVTADADFVDGTTDDSFEGVPGTLTATCP